MPNENDDAVVLVLIGGGGALLLFLEFCKILKINGLE